MKIALMLLWLFATVTLVSLSSIELNNKLLSPVEKIFLASLIVFGEFGISLLIGMGLGLA